MHHRVINLIDCVLRKRRERAPTPVGWKSQMEFAFESMGPTLRIIVLIFLLVFVVLIVGAAAGVAALPGWIARRRNHPQAAAVNVAGWFGLPTGIVWVLAMVWAYVRTAPSEMNGGGRNTDWMASLESLEKSIGQMEQAIGRMQK